MKPFNRHAAVELVASTLRSPPARSHIERPVARGDLVAVYYLPLDLCPTTNATRHTVSWVHAKRKAQIWKLMQAEELVRRAPRRIAPLPGRPQVLALRLSAHEPDKYSDWAKAAVDMVTTANPRNPRDHRLGYLRGDSPSEIDLCQWWEPAPRGQGCVMIEVRTGGL